MPVKHLLTVASALALSLAMAAPAAQAQPDRRNDQHGDQHGGPAPVHSDWRKGGHIQSSDWQRGARVDYRSHHLRKPPRGYEWRQVDGNYVLAAAATGLIAGLIAAGH